MFLIQVLFNGLVSGAIIALFAFGFQLVYLPTRILYIASSSIFALSPFLVNSFDKLMFPRVLSILIAVIFVLLLSASIELLNHRMLEHKYASSTSHMMSSLAISIILVQLIVMVWDTDHHLLEINLKYTYNWFGLVITSPQLLSLITCLIIFCSLYFLFTKTTIGLGLRALADNHMELALHGFNNDQYRLIAFIFSGFLIFASSILMSIDVGFEANNGMEIFLLALVAIIVGGRKSFIGPVIGSFIVGLLCACVEYFLSSSWQQVITFLMLSIFLYVQPEGIRAPKSRLELFS